MRSSGVALLMFAFHDFSRSVDLGAGDGSLEWGNLSHPPHVPVSPAVRRFKSFGRRRSSRRVRPSPEVRRDREERPGKAGICPACPSARAVYPEPLRNAFLLEGERFNGVSLPAESFVIPALRERQILAAWGDGAVRKPGRSQKFVAAKRAG
jgi:hypothetical protein